MMQALDGFARFKIEHLEPFSWSIVEANNKVPIKKLRGIGRNFEGGNMDEELTLEHSKVQQKFEK